MADILLATSLLLGGLGWSFVCLLALANTPIPGQADLGAVVWAGPIAFVAGLVWWGWIIAGWLT